MQDHDIEQNFVEIDSAVHEPDPKLLAWAQQQWAQQPDEEFVDEVPVAEAIVDAVPDELPNAVEEELHDDELAVKSNPVLAQKLAEVLHTKYRAEKQRRGYFLTFDQHRELIARSKKSAEKAQLISGASSEGALIIPLLTLSLGIPNLCSVRCRSNRLPRESSTSGFCKLNWLAEMPSSTLSSARREVTLKLRCAVT